MALRPSLAAIVPATNDPPTLERCLAAVREADEPPEEVIVVESPRNAGPAEARNAGAAEATADVLVFVDSDVLVHDDAFARIRKAFAADPGLAGLFGAYDDRPEAPGTVSRFRNLLHHHVHTTAAGPASTFWAGLGAMRRDRFAAAGGFDAKRYPLPSIEDIELGVRVTATGARLVLDPAVQGTHVKAWTLGDMVRTDLLRRGAPWIALVLRTGASPTALNLGWRNRVTAVAYVLALVGAGRRKPLPAFAALAVAAGLNASFYSLLVRRLGAPRAAAAVGLHVLHVLTAVASIPAGLALYLDEARRGSPR
jgi:GT2 family glycosyltransferase